MQDTFLQLARSRRSVRGYARKEIEKEKLDYIIESARLAPSACNKQPWRFIVVDEDVLLKEICKKGMGGIVSNKWAETAPVIIVLCAVYSPIVHTAGKMVKGVDYRLVDTGIAGEHFCLAAQEQGLGTCWIGWFNARAIKKVLNIPRIVKIVSLITLGYPAHGDTGIKEKKRMSRDEICFFNKYGT